MMPDNEARPGSDEVAEVLHLLDGLEERSVAEHPGVFERVHSGLSEILGDLDVGPSSVPQSEQA